jgi:transposase
VKNVTTYVGIDAHKKDLFFAMLVGTQVKPVTWTITNEPNAIRRVVRKLEREAPGAVRACYEAGPCGYALQRQLTTARVACQVIAPALIPRKPGERIKTDRRDARKLAELFRAGLLTEVRPPTPDEEAVRDLCRARDDVREDLQRSRHRLGKLLLRRGLHYRGRNWTQAHRRWIESLEWTRAAEHVVVDDYLLAIEQLETRRGELDAQLAEIAETDPYRERVGWLRCFRGIDTLTAMLILAELHDFRRFQSPRALMAYLGGLQWREASTGPHHADRQHAGPPAPRGNGVALSTPGEYRCGPDAPTRGTAGPRDCDRRQGAAATVPAVPTPDGATQTRTQGGRGDRAGAGRVPVGGSSTGTHTGQLRDAGACTGEDAGP